MALEFKDWGLTPEQKVASQKQALGDFTDVAQPATKTQEARERGKLAGDVYSQTAQAAKAGNLQAISPIVAKAQAQAAELIPQQKTRAQDLAYQGAMYKEGILGTKQNAAVGDFERDTMVYKDKAAKMLAASAFEQGYSAKELAMSLDGSLSDAGLAQLKSDYNEGRITKQELTDIGNKLAIQANQMKLQLQEDLAKLRGELERDIATGNVESAKKRLTDHLNRQKEAAQTAAKATNTGSIISGITGIIGGVAAGFASGWQPAAVATGYSAGSKVGDVAQNF